MQGRALFAFVTASLLAGCTLYFSDEVAPDGGSATDGGGVAQHKLTIHFAGTGHGWARMSTAPAPNDTGELCFDDCTFLMPADSYHVYVRAGTTQHMSTTCGLETTPSKECEFTHSSDREVTVTFEPELGPREVSTLFLDQPVLSLAFMSDGDLVVATADSLRRIGVDGTQRWSIPLAARTSRVSKVASDRIFIGPDLAAYNANGTLAWQSAAVATALAVAPNGDPVVVTSTGTVARLSATNGSIKWQTAAPGAKAVAVNSTGTVVAASGYRFDANGAALAAWSAPGSLNLPTAYVAFDANDQLVSGNTDFEASHMPNPFVQFYRYDPQGTATLWFQRDQYLDSLEWIANGMFTWGQVRGRIYNPLTLTASVYSATLGQTWEVRKGYGYGSLGYDTNLGDGITPTAAACSAAGRCALAGDYTGPAPNGTDPFGDWPLANWIGVYDTQ